MAKDRFDSADGNLSMIFGGRGGLVEWARLNRGGEVSFFGVVTAEPTPLRTAAKDGVEVKAEAAPRTAPRPWPQFRGPQASGVGDGQGAPAAWNVATGQGVRFKTPIPGIGLSSPIVWGDRIFLTTAVSGKGDTTFRTGLYGDPSSVDDLSEHSFRLYALDAATGRVIWEREVYRGAPKVRRHLKSSLANATPATDGERVVVLFGAIGKLAAYGFDGKHDLAAGHRHPRLQRSAVRQRRMGARQLAHPLWRPGSDPGGPAQGLLPRRLPAGDGRGSLAGGARGASPPGGRPTSCRRLRATS